MKHKAARIQCDTHCFWLFLCLSALCTAFASSCLAQSVDLSTRSDRLERLKKIVLENDWEDSDHLHELRGLLNVVLDSKDSDAADFIQDWLQHCQPPKNADSDFFEKYLLIAFAHSRFRRLPDPISIKVTATNDGTGTKLKLPQIVVELINSDQFNRPIQIAIGGGEFDNSGRTDRIAITGQQNGTPVKKRSGRKGELAFGGFIRHVTLLPNESIRYTLWLHDYIETPALGQVSINVTFKPFLSHFDDSGRFADVNAEPLNVDIVVSEQALLKAEYTELTELIRELSSSCPIVFVSGEFDPSIRDMAPTNVIANQILTYGDSAFPVLLARLNKSESELERGWILSLLATLAQTNDPTEDNEKNLLGNFILQKPMRILNIDGPDGQGLTRTYPGGTAFFWFGKYFRVDPREALKLKRNDTKSSSPEIAEIIAATPTDYFDDREPNLHQQIEFSKRWDSWNDAVKLEIF